mgnify:FL=1
MCGGEGNDRVFIKTIHKSGIQTALLLAGIVAAAAALLHWPQAVSGGVSRGLSICSTVIIPSLFPFLVLAGFLVRSGVGAAVGRRLERPVRFLFGLPGCCASAILISLVGGYPAGGVAVGELVRTGQITQREGKRLLRFCVNAGPAFILSTVGAGLLGNMRYGLVLFGAHIAASLLLGILGHVLDGRRPRKETAEKRPKPELKLPAAAAFVESVNAACRSLLYMCGFVVLFAALLALCDVTGISGFFTWLLTKPFSALGLDASALSCLLPCLLEVSCGCVEAAGAGAMAPLLLGLAMGWGGLSVHCQLAASLHPYHLMDRGFFAGRALHALLAGMLSVLLFRIIPLPVGVFSPMTDAIVVPYATSAVTSLALLVMCALLLLTGARSRKIGIGNDR